MRCLHSAGCFSRFAIMRACRWRRRLPRYIASRRCAMKSIRGRFGVQCLALKCGEQAVGAAFFFSPYNSHLSRRGKPGIADRQHVNAIWCRSAALRGRREPAAQRVAARNDVSASYGWSNWAACALPPPCGVCALTEWAGRRASTCAARYPPVDDEREILALDRGAATAAAARGSFCASSVFVHHLGLRSLSIRWHEWAARGRFLRVAGWASVQSPSLIRVPLHLPRPGCKPRSPGFAYDMASSSCPTTLEAMCFRGLAGLADGSAMG